MRRQGQFCKANANTAENGPLGRKWEVGRLESLLDKRSTFISERNEEVFGGGEGTEEEIPKQAANQAQECVSMSKGSGL